MEIFPNMNIQGTQVDYSKALQYNPSFEHSVKMHHSANYFQINTLYTFQSTSYYNSSYQQII